MTGWAGGARWLIHLVIGLWAVVTLSFLCLYILPGDPARIVLGPQASQSSIEQFRTEHALDRPVVEQYGRYVTGLAQLDLGFSYSRRQGVAPLVVERVGSTMLLTMTALSVAIVIGLMLPLALAVRRAQRTGGAISATLQTVAFVPPYLLALAILIIATTLTNLTPVLFAPSRSATWILASLALAVYPTALLFQVFTQALEKQLGSSYALRAAATGLDHRSVVIREALPNALDAPLSALANAAAYFFTSAFFVEAVFGIPGLGRLAQDAVRVKDLALLNGVCLTYCIVVGLFAALLDLVPRALRHAEGTSR